MLAADAAGSGKLSSVQLSSGGEGYAGKQPSRDQTAVMGTSEVLYQLCMKAVN